MDNKEKILQSATILFSKKGISQTSLRDIAKGAGISRGTLFYHYSTKDELLYDVLDRFLNGISAIVRYSTYENSNGERKLALEESFNLLTKSEFLMKINLYFIEEAFTGDGAIREKLIEKYQEWHGEFKELLLRANKTLSDRRIGLRATILLATIDGICMQYLLEPDAINLHVIVKELGEMVNEQMQYDIFN